MIDLKCPNCSASISLDETREYGFCSYCGTKIQLVQKVRMIHEGTVNVGGIKTEQQQIETAKKMIEIGEQGEAKRILNSIVRYSPDCGEAWLELTKLIANEDIDYVLVRRKERGDWGFSGDGSVLLVKDKLYEWLTKSQEYCMARKLLGNQADIALDPIIKSWDTKIQYCFQKSDNYIRQILAEPMNLNGYSGKSSDDSPTIFFAYKNKIFYKTIVHIASKPRIESAYVYYQIDDIVNGNIHMILCNLEKTPKMNVAQYITFRIRYARENYIYTSLGEFGKDDYSSKIELSQYDNMIKKRQKEGLCIICGSATSLFRNCLSKCKKYIK